MRKQDDPERIGSDPIVRPAYYYNDGKADVGPLDYAEQQELSIKQHAVIKYTTRAGRKPGNTALKDYKQAQFYLNRLIAEEEQKDSEATSTEELRHTRPYCVQCGHTFADNGDCEGVVRCLCANSIHAVNRRVK
jgi:hypothetical protein